MVCEPRSASQCLLLSSRFYMPTKALSTNRTKDSPRLCGSRLCKVVFVNQWARVTRCSFTDLIYFIPRVSYNLAKTFKKASLASTAIYEAHAWPAGNAPRATHVARFLSLRQQTILFNQSSPVPGLANESSMDSPLERNRSSFFDLQHCLLTDVLLDFAGTVLWAWRQSARECHLFHPTTRE
jgi:hypothetical protein